MALHEFHDDLGGDDNGAVYRGHRVVDEHRRPVGKISDVIFGDDGVARWAVVDPGLFRAEHYVPLDESYISLDQELVVPYDRRTVTKSPRAEPDHVMSTAAERMVEDYYKLAS